MSLYRMRVCEACGNIVLDLDKCVVCGHKKGEIDIAGISIPFWYIFTGTIAGMIIIGIDLYRKLGMLGLLLSCVPAIAIIISSVYYWFFKERPEYLIPSPEIEALIRSEFNVDLPAYVFMYPGVNGFLFHYKNGCGVAVSSGALKLNRKSLVALIGHEMGHYINRDWILVDYGWNFAVSLIVGWLIIAPVMMIFYGLWAEVVVFGVILCILVIACIFSSREREHYADIYAAFHVSREAIMNVLRGSSWSPALKASCRLLFHAPSFHPSMEKRIDFVGQPNDQMDLLPFKELAYLLVGFSSGVVASIIIVFAGCSTVAIFSLLIPVVLCGYLFALDQKRVNRTNREFSLSRWFYRMLIAGISASFAMFLCTMDLFRYTSLNELLQDLGLMGLLIGTSSAVLGVIISVFSSRENPDTLISRINAKSPAEYQYFLGVLRRMSKIHKIALAMLVATILILMLEYMRLIPSTGIKWILFGGGIIIELLLSRKYRALFKLNTKNSWLCSCGVFNEMNTTICRNCGKKRGKYICFYCRHTFDKPFDMCPNCKFLNKTR